MPVGPYGKTTLRIASVLAVIGAGVIWWLQSREPAIRNVLIISLDTTRADHLGCYGFSQPTTPHLDALAQEGVLFEQAVSPIALTLPAHISALTGTYPPYHQVHSNIKSLPSSSLTLAEVLREHGLNTCAVVSSYVLRRGVGLDQGFTVYDDQFDRANASRQLERKGEEVTRHVNEYLANHRDGGFFLLAHYYDPHEQYVPPEPFASRYPDHPYAGEIAYMDECIGAVLQQLKRLGLYESTLIVVMGDHGEGLGEHNETEHGYYLYQSTTRVPLILRVPGEPGGEQVSHVVNLVDVMPTVLGYLQIPIPAHVQGRDLSGVERGQSGPTDRRQVYTESMVPLLYGCNPLFSVVENGWKYIESTRPELYDLRADPGERVNLYHSTLQRVTRMRKDLATLVQQYYRPDTLETEGSLDEESLRRLKSLGYIGGEIIDPLYEIQPEAPDAKDRIVYYEACHQVDQLNEQNEHQLAYQRCLRILKDFPHFTKTHFLLGEASFLQGQWRQCIRHMESFVAGVNEDSNELKTRVFGFDLQKTLFTSHQQIARSHHELAQYDQAETHYRTMLSFKIEDASFHRDFANTLVCLGRIDEALSHFRLALENDPRDARTHEQLSDALLRQGDLKAALGHLRGALEITPSDQSLRNRLTVLANTIHQEETIVHHLQVVGDDPENAESHGILAATFLAKRQIPLAIRHFQERIRLRPDDFASVNNLAWIYAASREEQFRDSQQALELAQRAARLSRFQEAGVLDTLAVAYAAAGKFTEAVQMAEKAIQLNPERSFAEEVEKRLRRYRAGQPYRD